MPGEDEADQATEENHWFLLHGDPSDLTEDGVV